MTPPPILELAGVGKSYRSYPSLWWRAAGWLTGRSFRFTDHWVLRDVSFTLRAGEAVGIVGRNGAGKSTLLKAIAGTLVPTQGQLAVRGSVSAILELGMGFNPEFTGRENVVYSCGLLGYDPAVIAELMPWIEAFADVGHYFDQPMRTYSSGMTVRVAFAVATAVRPDILIVDEALSVGDAAFQRKSFSRIESFLAEGTSLLFVSHAMESVRALCEHAIWIEHGALAMDGSAKLVTEAYERSLFVAPTSARSAVRSPRGYFDDSLLTTPVEQQYGDGGATIVDVRFVDKAGRPINSLEVGESFLVEFTVEFAQACEDAQFGMLLKTVEGVTVYGTNTDRMGLRNRFAPGERVQVSFTLRNNLCPGLYFLNCGASAPAVDGRRYLHRRVDVAALKVLARDGEEETVTGLAYLEAKARLQPLELVNE
jgi:lipopolysaccharide transport system ATP-binding protein